MVIPGSPPISPGIGKDPEILECKLAEEQGWGVQGLPALACDKPDGAIQWELALPAHAAEALRVEREVCTVRERSRLRVQERKRRQPSRQSGTWSSLQVQPERAENVLVPRVSIEKGGFSSSASEEPTDLNNFVKRTEESGRSHRVPSPRKGGVRKGGGTRSP